MICRYSGVNIYSMISRISSFSGPLAKLFIARSMTQSMATSGLILQWEIGNSSLYVGSGAAIEDMTANSADGTIVGTISYESGYLSIQGSATEYVRTGDLNSYLSPATTGTSISAFLWVYPTTNGIILAEEGTTSGDAGSWYDAQIQRNSSGNYLFGVWPYASVGSPRITSSATYSLNEWHYVGYTYDGTTLKGYVNGALAGSSAVIRQSPGNSSFGMYYYVGYPTSTNMVTAPGGFGQGPASDFRFGGMHVYNRGISAAEVLGNFESERSAYGI